MKIKINSIIYALILALVGSTIGEITLGNPDFLVTVMTFIITHLINDDAGQ